MAAELRVSSREAVRFAIIVLGLLVCPMTAVAGAGVTQGVPLRNQNPFLQIFGLPPFQSAQLATRNAFDLQMSVDIVNHADSATTATEDAVIDGESYFLTVSMRRSLSDRLEVGFDLPLVSHQEGFLDSAIKDWHDLLGLSNSKRRGVNDQLAYRYSSGGQTLYELDSPTAGIGDIQLTAAMPLRKADEASALSVSLRSAIKLPTGSADELSGSGAADFSLGLYASNSYRLWQRDLDLSGFAGALLLGDGDVLPDLQRSAVPYGGLAASYWIADRFGISMQLQLEGPYFDVDVAEIGGSSAQFAVGFDYRLRQHGTSLHLSITEDIAAATTATPDFGIHFSVRKTERQ